VEQRGHVLHRVDGDAHLAHFALGQCVVGVQADLGGQVERDAETRLALLQEVTVPLVALLGGGVAGVLAHGPEASPIHGRLNAANVRILPGKTELRETIRVNTLWWNNRFKWNFGRGLEYRFSLRKLTYRTLIKICSPIFKTVLICHSYPQLKLVSQRP